ncbi:MAG: sensor histidine kinase, partial [Cyanobacteria bacterium J083]
MQTMDDNSSLQAKLKETQLAHQRALQMAQFQAGFLARTSHELRSPLSRLISLHQLIINGLCENPAEEKEFINQAYEAGLNLMKLLDEIVNVSKAVYGSNPLKIESLFLGKILQETQELTKIVAANRNFSLNFATVDPDIQILADHSRLIQALITLIETAIANTEVGAIEVSWDVVTTSKRINIVIDTPANSQAWSEAIDLMANQTPTAEEITTKTISQLSNIKLSPAMK